MEVPEKSVIQAIYIYIYIYEKELVFRIRKIYAITV